MDAINPAHGSVLRVNSPSLGIFSLPRAVSLRSVTPSGPAVGRRNGMETVPRKGRVSREPRVSHSRHPYRLSHPSPLSLLASFPRGSAQAVWRVWRECGKGCGSEGKGKRRVSLTSSLRSFSSLTRLFPFPRLTSLLYVSFSLRSLRVRLRSVRDETTEGRRDEKGTRRAVEGGGNGLSSRCSSFPCRSHPSFTSHVGSSCSTPPSVPSGVGNRHEEKVKDVRKSRVRWDE